MRGSELDQPEQPLKLKTKHSSIDQMLISGCIFQYWSQPHNLLLEAKKKKNMFKRIGLITLGFIALSGVAYLGWLASGDASLVVWFGLASAILAPGAFALMGYAIKSGEDELLKKLSKVPELQQLIEKAQNQEEKIRALETERKHLEEVVKFEVMRSSLIERKTSIENEGARILENLDSIDEQLAAIDKELEGNPDRDEILQLRSRIESRVQGDIVLELGSTRIAVNSKKLQMVPGGTILIAYATLISEIFKVINKLAMLLTKHSSGRNR